MLGVLRSLLLTFERSEGGYLLQYPRVVMVKVFVVCALICAWRGHYDDLTCHVHEDNAYKDVIQQSCWNSGVYVYKELRNTEMYGLPTDIEKNGMENNETLCRTRTRGGMLNRECKEMRKVYFKQYQYMHYIVFLCVFLYFIPHLLHTFIGDDVIKLKRLLQTLPPKPTTRDISQQHVTLRGEDDLNKLHELNNIVHKRNLNETVKQTIDEFFITEQQSLLQSHLSVTFHKLRQPLDVVFRLVYGFLNLVPLCLIDCVYNGNFSLYGCDWFKEQLRLWYDQGPGYDSSSGQSHITNMFLPPLALCDVRKVVGKDVERLHFTKLICQMNKHSQLQYVFLFLWALLVIGCILSVLDFIKEFINVWKTHQTYTHVCKDFNSNSLNLNLTSRQVKYFVLIYETHCELLNDIVVKLSLSYRQRGADYRQRDASPYREVREKPVRDSLDTALLRRSKLKGIEEVEVDMDLQRLHDDGGGYNNTLL